MKLEPNQELFWPSTLPGNELLVANPWQQYHQQQQQQQEYDSQQAVQQQAQQDAIHVSELVELLADRATPIDVQIQTAVMLQHLTYLDPFVKAEVASFNVSMHLVSLLAAHHRNPNIPRIFSLSILGALRNLCSGADSMARKELTNGAATPISGIAVLLDVIGAHQSIDAEETAVRELATAVLWNISVDADVVSRLTEDGVLDVISRAIILPAIQFATKAAYTSAHSWAGWGADFRNSAGVLRNATALLSNAGALVNGSGGIAPLRMLIEAFTVAVRFSVTQQDTESKAVENIVCFLQNITAAISAETTSNVKLKRATSTPNGLMAGANHNDDGEPTNGSSFGCALVGSQWCLSRQNRTATLMAASRAGGGDRRGADPNEKQLVGVNCARSLIEALLPLLADCSNPTTLEAGLGTIRNVVSIASPPFKLRDAKLQLSVIAENGCADVAREAVWRHGGLPIIVDLLAITSDGVLRAAASVLAALATGQHGTADTDGILVVRELIGKQALDRLVRKVPSAADAAVSADLPSDAAICAILAAILIIVRPFSSQQQAAFHQQITTPSSPAAFALHAVSDLGLVQRMLFLVRPERFGLTQVTFDGQAKRLAQAVLATLWQHTELRPAYARLGIDRSAFFPSTISSTSTLSQQHLNNSNNMANRTSRLGSNSSHELTAPGQQHQQHQQQIYDVYGGHSNVYQVPPLPMRHSIHPADVYMHEQSSSSSSIGTGGVYGVVVGVAPGGGVVGDYLQPNNGSLGRNDYVNIESRMAVVGGVGSGSSNNGDAPDGNPAAARIEVRRGSSSSSWAAAASASRTAQVIPAATMSHDSLASVSEPINSLLPHPSIEGSNGNYTNGNNTVAHNGNNNANNIDSQHDDGENGAMEDPNAEMFALSQLGPAAAEATVEHEHSHYYHIGNGAGVDTETAGAVKTTMNDGQDSDGGQEGTAMSDADKAQMQANGSTGSGSGSGDEVGVNNNRDLFMLALNSDAPDSWV